MSQSGSHRSYRTSGRFQAPEECLAAHLCAAPHNFHRRTSHRLVYASRRWGTAVRTIDSVRVRSQVLASVSTLQVSLVSVAAAHLVSYPLIGTSLNLGSSSFSLHAKNAPSAALFSNNRQSARSSKCINSETGGS